MTKISVLMPIYKTPENYLREAVESILNQTYKDFEFLILDDCPSDDRESIIKSYSDKRVKYFKNSRNLGISASRNKLIDIAAGEYLAVMDHDDVSLPERFAKEVDFMDKHSETGVVGTWYRVMSKNKDKKKFIVNSQIEKDLMYNCAIVHPSAMIRKSVLDGNNIRYEEQFSPAEDYALWCRLIGRTKFANIPEVLFCYRDHENNTSHLQAERMIKARDMIREFVRDAHPDIFAACSDRISFCGIPFAVRKLKGFKYSTTWFGLFKTVKKAVILTEERLDA